MPFQSVAAGWLPLYRQAFTAHRHTRYRCAAGHRVALCRQPLYAACRNGI